MVENLKQKPRRLRLLAAGALAILVLAAWANSLAGEFVLDDDENLTRNASIRSLATAFAPPSGSGLGGRPVANFSFAANYALGGFEPAGYHAVNLAIHLAAALTLLGLVRRTLLSAPLRTRYGAEALPLALVITVLWAVHPAQTEAVTYLVQRTESLMGLFYFLTLYGLVRGTESARPAGWFAVSVAACALGMATKEVMVTAPALVLLYDRTFVAGSFAAALRARWKLHLALATTWLLLAWLLLGASDHARGIGFAHGAGAWDYALTSCRSLVRYLRVAAWPHPLVFDYGAEPVPSLTQAAGPACVVFALVAAAAWAVVRRPALGFAGVWCLVTLAPTTSFVPVAFQPFAEHRLYLPLAGLAAMTVLALYALAGRRVYVAGGALALVLVALTLRRNTDYRTALGLWLDTVAKNPGNPRAHDYAGGHLAAAGRVPEAVAHWEAALRLNPVDFVAHTNLASFLAVRDGLTPEARGHFAAAIRAQPSFASTHAALGEALAIAGDSAAARGQLALALRLDPDQPAARLLLGRLLLAAGDPAAALPHLAEAVRLTPGSAPAHNELGRALAAAGRMADALVPLRRAAELSPRSSAVHYNLGNALVRAGRPAEAVASYARALRLEPGAASAHNNLGTALLLAGRPAEAVPQFEAALRLAPGETGAQKNLAAARAAVALPR